VEIVAPSDMMDGRSADQEAALEAREFIPRASWRIGQIASGFYGPFREAVG